VFKVCCCREKKKEEKPKSAFGVADADVVMWISKGLCKQKLEF